MSAPAFRSSPEPTPPDRWAALQVEAPKLSGTARRYLAQIEVSMSPATMEKTDEVLACFCAYLVAEHPDVSSFADVGRRHIEAYKAHLARRATPWGTLLKPNTRRAHLMMVRVFFDRVIEWGYPDAPAFTPVFRADLPKAPEPLPKALDDAASARFLAAVAQDTDRCRQLCLEILARTGIRVGELCALRADALSARSGSWWIKVPVGKLRNDRYVPAHPRLVELLKAWQGHHDDNATGLLITVGGKPLDRHLVSRWVKKVAREAGIGHAHPHQLRHTLATQAVNRGMRIEAVAELLGHRNLRMTQVYARISNRTVADQFAAVSERVDSLYADPDSETPSMRRLRLEHRRLLANGWCTRPQELGCHFEAICEGCGFFETTVEFLPILRRQRDHAAAHGQTVREDLYERLVAGVEEALP